MEDQGPLRVVQLITTLARGGAQATVLASKNMDEYGAEVTVLAGPDDPGEGTHWGELLDAGAAVIEVPTLRRSLAPLADLRTLVWLVRWLRKVQPDVLHTHSSKAGVLGRLAAALAGIPVAHTVHGWSFAAADRTGTIERLIRAGVVLLERLLARLSSALVVVTPVDEDAGLQNGIGRPGQYRVIRSGVELEEPRLARTRRTQLRSELGIADLFVVGAIGRLAPQKELNTLIEAFALAATDDETFGQEACLLIVGDGPDRDQLEALAQRLDIADQTTFLGQRSDAATVVAAFDVFALTSRWEGLPRTVVEAMAADVPVVATPVGGVGEVVRCGETGTIIDPGDVDGLAARLREIHRHPVEFARLSAQAGESIDGFSADRMRHDLGELWSELASTSH